jgi:Na+-translocating ferredoxin:NAD+ oxidoreductase RnfD subunit
MISKIKNYILENRYFYAKLSLTSSHISLVLISFIFYNFQRSYYQVYSAFIAAAIAEVICFKIFDRYKGDTYTNRIFSAIAESAGLLVLIRSLSPNYYAIGSIIAVVSKYIFRRSDGRHIFNPTNFIIVVSIAFAEAGTFQVRADEFSYNLYPIMHVLFFGLTATILAKIWIIPLTYILSYVALAFLVGFGTTTYGNFVDIIGPEIGATGLIFIFLMITDPATSPRTQIGKIIFAASVAILGFIGRTQIIIYSNFIALFICYLVYNIYIESHKLKESFKPINTQ